ncbi:hypothetical protein [Pseudomonas sp. LTJR-52]|uniref:hypothetical protein n=1 Tax=Pseudomonas sp. LTJR-52 TaxID=2479392 RepID=UPI0013CEE6C0|nr:hypothetical protein [Pseudomonas sp. LTJR-52]
MTQWKVYYIDGSEEFVLAEIVVLKGASAIFYDGAEEVHASFGVALIQRVIE